jgi:protein TonB
VSKRFLIPAIVVATLGAMVLSAWFVMGLAKKDSAKKAPKITLMTPLAPPPPPPPPPKFEKKPDPPKEQKEMKVEQPVPKQDSPPPSPELKMDGPAGNGPSAFGAGKITSEDLSKVGIGKPGGTGSGEKTGMFNPYTNFVNLAKGEVQRYLGKNGGLRRKRYVVELHLWVTPVGAISRYELLGGTGDSDTDEVIGQALAALPGFSQPLPANMPQPIRLRVSTGG